MLYLAILGRQPEISLAELESLFPTAKFKSYGHFCTFELDKETPNIDHLGGTIKLAEKLNQKPLEYLANLPEGKLTIGVSDLSSKANKKSATLEALKLKKILVRHGRSVRVIENKEAEITTATSLHNGLSGKNERKVELIKTNDAWFKVIGIQDIDAYTRRDQARPARDAKVGMLPPKLAQILINLCGPLPEKARILDPFCGTGVVLQEALLMRHTAYGTDISEKMIEYSKKNLEWLIDKHDTKENLFEVTPGDATTFSWTGPIDAVACESYLGSPMSKPPVDIKLKTEKQECKTIILDFLKNLAPQIKTDTPIVIAIPAWLRESGEYSRLEILDDIANLGYNVNNKSREGLLYHRKDQVVARDIIILRKK